MIEVGERPIDGALRVLRAAHSLLGDQSSDRPALQNLTLTSESSTGTSTVRLVMTSAMLPVTCVHAFPAGLRPRTLTPQAPGFVPAVRAQSDAE